MSVSEQSLLNNAGVAHALYQEAIKCVGEIESNFVRWSRIVGEFIADEKLVLAMGWESWQDIFREPEVATVIRRLEKMRLNSPAQRYRWRRAILVDREIPDAKLLEADNLSTILQTPRIKEIEEIAFGDKSLPEKIIEIQNIIEDSVDDDPPTLIVNVQRSGNRVYFNDRPVGEIVPNAPYSDRFASGLYHLPGLRYKAIRERNRIYAVDAGGIHEVMKTTNDPEFLEYLHQKLRCAID